MGHTVATSARRRRVRIEKREFIVIAIELESTRSRTRLGRRKKYTSRPPNHVDTSKYLDLHNRRSSFASDVRQNLSTQNLSTLVLQSQSKPIFSSIAS